MRARASQRHDRVFVFVGEPAIAEERANAVVADLVPASRRDLDLEIVRLPDDSIERVSEALCQVGMFSSGRCVLLKGPLDQPEQMERLLQFLETRLPADAALVVATSKLDGRSKLHRWLHENGRIEDLRVEKKPDGRAAGHAGLADIVVARLHTNGFPAPSGPVLEAIVARAGSSLGELCQDIDRLCLAIGTARPLTRKDVTDHVRDAAGAWIFDFVDAICERRTSDALTLVADLISAGEPPLRLVATLSTRVADFLVAARYASAAKLPPPPQSAGAFAKTVYPSLPETARKRFVNPYRTYHIFRVAQSRGYRSLRRLHRQLCDLDLALKSGAGLPRHLMTEFVAAACESRA